MYPCTWVKQTKIFYRKVESGSTQSLCAVNHYKPFASPCASPLHGNRPLKEYYITATEENAHVRLDKFLADGLIISRNKVQEAIKNQLVIVNDHVVKANYVIQPDDQIHACMPIPIDLLLLIPENICLDIVYEDEAILVINKPVQMVVHPDETHRTGTLANALCYRYKHLPLKDNMPTRPGLVHRIDKNTSGLLVVAKTAASLASLSQQFYAHTVERTYYTLVWGSPVDDAAMIDIHIGKDKRNRQMISVFPDAGQGKRSITHYKVIQRLHNVTFLSCKLATGRTHQIRVHMKHIGHPVFGDTLYGGHLISSGQQYVSYKSFVNNCLKLMPHQALHAAVLGFIHPTTQESMVFEAPLPENFVKLLQKWSQYVSSRMHHVEKDQNLDSAIF